MRIKASRVGCRLSLRKGVYFALAFLFFPLGAGLFSPGRAFAQNAISTGTRAGFRMYYPGSNDWWLDPSKGSFDIRVNGHPAAVTLNALGNLGIGTASPLAKLHIAGAVDLGFAGDLLNHTALFDSAGGLGAGGLTIGTLKFGTGAAVQTFNNAPLLLQPNGGNLGIGTTSPFSKLNFIVDPTVNFGAFGAANGAGVTNRIVTQAGNGGTSFEIYDQNGSNNNIKIFNVTNNNDSFVKSPVS